MGKSQAHVKRQLKMDSRDPPGMWINSICISIWNVMQNAAAGFAWRSGTLSAAFLSLKWPRCESCGMLYEGLHKSKKDEKPDISPRVSAY